MTWGGSRQNSGRPKVLSASEVERIAAACERVWHWCSPNNKRPYYYRPYVMFSAAVFYSKALDRFVSIRRIEAAWKAGRTAGITRAQPLELAYADARSINDFMDDRLQRQFMDDVDESFERLSEWVQGTGMLQLD